MEIVVSAAWRGWPGANPGTESALTLHTSHTSEVSADLPIKHLDAGIHDTTPNQYEYAELLNVATRTPHGFVPKRAKGCAETPTWALDYQA